MAVANTAARVASRVAGVAFVRSIQWPVHGDRIVFRRALLIHALLGAGAIVAPAAAITFAVPGIIATILPLTIALVLLELVWSHGRAQASARRAEIRNSFAGLTILHHGHAIRVAAEDPLVGEFDSRRSAAQAAVSLGNWAVIVRAYDRYFVLAGTRTERVGTPVAFRTSAVADVVPAIHGEAISA